MPIDEIIAATPLAETIYLNPQGKFDVEFIPVQGLYRDNLSRISDALNACVSANAFRENSEEIVFLREMMTRHSDDPQRIHDDCRFAHSCVQDLVAKDIVADSFGVKRLLDTLSIAVTDIIANEPSVKNAVTARKAYTVRPTPQLTQANQTALLEHSQAAIDITTNQLGIELDEDAKDVAIVFGKKDKIDAVYRLISRWSRIYAKISSASKMQITDAVLGTFIQAQPHLEAILNILRPLLSGIA